MKLIEKTINFISKRKKRKEKIEIQTLINYLKELKSLEAKLWGITIKQIQNGEENILEDSNHMIYLLSREKHKHLKEILKEKKVETFFKDIQNLKEDFNYLKKKILEKNRLKNQIANFTIKVVKPNNYNKMKKIFLLEKKLYETIDSQELELNQILNTIQKIKIKKNEEKIEEFIKYLKKIRTILAGQQDLHYLWDEQRLGYSNTSNLIYELINLIKINLVEK